MFANIQTNKLFLTTPIALIVTALTFAFRAEPAGVWRNEFHLIKEQVGWIFIPAFRGFTLAMIFGGPLSGIIGMKIMLGIVFIGHFAGFIIYLVARDATILLIATVFIGVAQGMAEAACNPLAITLYPEKKTTMLSLFLDCFPGGKRPFPNHFLIKSYK